MDRFATNWALQLSDRDRFIEAMVANAPDRPPYFSRSVAINLHGAPFLSDYPPLTHLELSKCTSDTVMVVDIAVRSPRACLNQKGLSG